MGADALPANSKSPVAVTGKRGGLRSTSFKPGQSGNPNGRPKKTEQLRRIEDLAKSHSDDAIAALVKIAKSGSNETARVSAANAILDRGWGKSVDRQESGEAGAFDGMTDTEVEAEARAALADGVKSGLIAVLPPKKK